MSGNTRDEIRVHVDYINHTGFCPCQAYAYPFDDMVSVHAQIFAHCEGFSE